ncbi:MAG: chemotaxis protein CheB [Prolixibacteraceae bacterium]|nr:chemotaxis protein CheB [Prolixibacteraceae bacterium]MBN2773697.1 chemotaxis protein CheB [Prolixibacteraceae bacterium]
MIRAIVIGASYGGMEAIQAILANLPENFKIPIFIVLHIGSNRIDAYLSTLNKKTFFTVKEAEEKEEFVAGTVYFAPPNYHLQVENYNSLSLSTDEKVNFSRPSIDVLFETASWVFQKELLGILLTGSNSDGALGMKSIHKFGGISIVEDPETAVAKAMPLSCIQLSKPDYILPLQQIAGKITELAIK